MKSWFMRRVAAQAGKFKAETPHLKDALSLWNLQPVREIVTVGLGCRGESPHADAR